MVTNNQSLITGKMKKAFLFMLVLFLAGFVANGIVHADTPVITTFVIPATSNSLTVPITSFTATDGLAVSGYFVTEADATPSLDNPAWIPEAPATYTFSTYGTKTLYAWVKDAAGNISASLSDSVVVTVLEAIAPAAPTGMGVQ